MAKEPQSPTVDAPAAAPGAQGVNIQLVPGGNADQPVFANLTLVHPASGVAFVDFGFLDPGALGALTQMARSGTKVPERMNGRLAVRVALGYDTVAQLHGQLGQVLAALARAQEAKK